MEWISTKVETPPDSETVIVLHHRTTVGTAFYDCDSETWDDTIWMGEITHWIPIPKLPNY